MKLRDPFPAPPFTHRFSALALAQGKPQKTPRTHTCEHMCAQCCSGMVSASTTPGHKAYLKHNLTQCVCWWGMGGALSQPLREHPALGLFKSLGLTLHI